MPVKPVKPIKKVQQRFRRRRNVVRRQRKKPAAPAAKPKPHKHNHPVVRRRRGVLRRVGRVGRAQPAKRPDTFDPAYEFGSNNYVNVNRAQSDAQDIGDGFRKAQDIGDGFPNFLKPVYVISIRRNRMDGFVHRMGKGWMQWMRRFPCVDGRFINRSTMVKQNKLKTTRRLSNGQIGCAESHIGVWRAIANGPHEYATVFEDDVAIDHSTNGPAILQRMTAAFNELQEKNLQWDFLSWGHGPWALQKNKPIPGLRHWKSPGMCQGFFAYTIKRSLAAYLVRHVYPFEFAIDIWVYRLAMANKFKAYCMSPLAFFVINGPSETSKMLP